MLDIDSLSMPTKRIERQIDDALLATATTAGFLYIRRRVRRMFSRIVLAATVTSGLSALGAAGVVLAWQRKRTQRP
jgi:DNA-binding PucR family transcriptional regulator